MTRALVLASTSSYRRRLLQESGYAFEVAAPDFDERSLDALLGIEGPERLAIEIARGKARSVHASGALILAADQVAVLDDGTMLTKPATMARAVDQLTSMAGRSHRLVNGLVLRDSSSGAEWEASDVHEVRMVPFDRAVAEAYVTAHRPLDSVGAYRIEDDAGLIDEVRGSGRSGVIGLPLDVVASLLDAAESRFRSEAGSDSDRA